MNNPTEDNNEILLRAIDILSMEILRLKSENEILKKYSIKENNKSNKRGVTDDTVWRKGINFYRREGFLNTFKKIFTKFL